MAMIKNKRYLLCLLSATALSAVVYITPAFAADPKVADVGDGVDPLTTTFNSAVDGVSISNGTNSIVITVFGTIDTANIGVSAQENNYDVSITLNADVTSTQSGVSATANAGSVTVTGSGNVTSGNAGGGTVSGIGAITTGVGDILVSGAGDTTSTGVVGGGNAAIFTQSSGGSGNTTITRSGTILSVGGGILATIAHSASNTDNLSITGIGAVSASADYSYSISMVNATKGVVTLNTSNAITNTGGEITIGVYAKSDGGLTDITVGDITMDIASTGWGIYVDNYFNATNGTSITINGTLTSGDDREEAVAIEVNADDGNVAQFTNIIIAASGIVNGIILVENSDASASTLQNDGIWNGYGEASLFKGNLINNGTINLQHNDAIDSAIGIGNGVQLSATSIIKVDAVHTTGDGISTFNTDFFGVAAGNIELDGTLDVNAVGAEALYSATSGITYTLFLNGGAGTTTGSFATLTDNLANLDLEVNIIDDDVVYHFVTRDIDFKPYTNGNNQDGAATAMDNFDYSTTEGQTLKTAFAALTNDEAEDAIKQIGGGDHQGASQSGAGTASGFQNAMMGGANGGGNGGGNSEPEVAGYTVTATGDVPAIGTAIWARALGGYAKLDKGTTVADLITHSFGVVGGVDYYVSDDTTIGLSGGYTRANFSVQTTGSNSYADNFHAGVSAHLGASSAFDTGFGLSAGADATLHNYHTKRNIVIGAVASTATSDYSGVTIGGTATARYGMDIGNKTILSTFAGLDASQTRNDAFAETGAGLLNISTDASSSKKLGSTIGFGLAGKVGDISASISAAWRHEFGDVNHTTTNTLAGSPTSYTSTTPTEARNKIMLNANVVLPLSDNSSLTFGAFGDLSRTSVNVGASASYKLKF